jgi:hypothetical protein
MQRATKSNENKLEEKETTMNTRDAVLLGMLAASSAVLSQEAIAGNGAKIALPSGQFSVTTQGSLAVCINSKTYVEESCSKKDALSLPLTLTRGGVETWDAKGEACATSMTLFSASPPNASPPNIFHTMVEKNITNYDPTTGIGDASFTEWSGGTCVGATFDKTGATVVSTGSVHFIVSQGGQRIDVFTTGLTTGAGSIGTFSLTGVLLKQ